MTNEERDLLIQDICGRLPYSVATEYDGEFYEILGYVHGKVVVAKPFSSISMPIDIESCRPILREIKDLRGEEKRKFDDLVRFAESNKDSHIILDFLNSIHVDYRELIPMGLARKMDEVKCPDWYGRLED